MSESRCGCGSSTNTVLLSDISSAAEIRPLSTKIGWRDVLGGWRVRWGIRRMRYAVPPGLYRIGQPDVQSPVLVTANYKLTVDTVRAALNGQNVWLLVLDTKGVNVWCAAGKGTFGTQELIHRIRVTNLGSVVKHRNLVVPQLGATGVAAHEVKLASGFAVHYGPVRAKDIPAYLASGMKATPAMRRVTFNWKERLVLTPTEIANFWKPALVALAAVFVLHLVQHRDVSVRLALDFVPILAAVLTGGVLVPLLLPLLPFRYFVLKGVVAGAALSAALLLLVPMSRTEAAGTTLVVLAITSFMAMMFTGATTFTTLAGARLEVRRGLPAILLSAGAGAILRITAIFV